jgi:hypothetical protein
VSAEFAAGLTTELYSHCGVQVRMEALLESDEFGPFKQIT